MKDLRLYICLLLSLLLWQAYVTWLLPPFELFMNSDASIPYLITTEPWIKQDFFFWSAERFGSVYAVPWKLLGRHIFGPSLHAFCSVHMGFFFIGTGFWLAALGTPLIAGCFLVLMLPIMIDRVDLFLFPGQMYAVLYFFMGVIFYLLLTRPTLSRRTSIALAVAVSAAYWQQIFTGIFLFSLIILKYLCTLGPGGLPAKRRVLTGAITPFLAVVAPLVILIELARRWEIAWENSFFYIQHEPWPVFVGNVERYLQHGLTFNLGPIFGLPFLWLIAAAGIVSLTQIRRREVPLFVRWLVPTLLFGALAFILGINAHGYAAQAERLFSFIPPLALMGLCVMAKLYPPRVVKIFATLALLDLTAVTLYRELYIRKDTIFDQSALASREQTFAGSRQRLDFLKAAGCSGLVDEYWTSYVLAAFSDGELPASASDVVRNPYLLRRIMSSDHFCLGRQANLSDLTAQLLEHSQCEAISPNYAKCRPRSVAAH